MLLKRIKQEETVQGFREMYSAVTWKISLITWLHHLLLDQLDEDYKTIYIEMLEILKIRVSFIEYLFFYCLSLVLFIFYILVAIIGFAILSQ